MAEEYDDIRDFWYQHLFDRIETIIREFAASLGNSSSNSVLDVGCGTGFQTQLYEQLGMSVWGIDIAERLVEIANRKLQSVSCFVANAEDLPFANASFDIVNCCGSTLSFITDYKRAIAEMARVLKPNGYLILETEQRWNLDLVWEIVNALVFNVFGFDETLEVALSHLCPPFDRGYCIDYPFEHLSGRTDVMRIRLFTASELEHLLGQHGISTLRQYGIHILTNIVPSTLLANPALPYPIRTLINLLAWMDQHLSPHYPFNRLGCSLLVIGEKT